MKSTTYLLILNMACGDLVTTILTCPSLIKYLFFGLAWLSGTFASVLCKLNLYASLVSILGCIFSLVGITVDRYLAVSRPLKHKPWSKWTKIIVPTIWVTAVLIPLNSWNEIGTVHRNSGSTYCIDGQLSISMMITLGICFLLPFTVMSTLYPIIAYHLWTRQVPGEFNAQQQQRATVMARKVTKMMIGVVVSFFICWSPQFVFVWMHPFAADLADSLPHWLIPFILWLEVLNCAMNPVLYVIFNESFRKGFKKVIHCGISRDHNLQIQHCANNQVVQTPPQNIALVTFHANLGLEN